MTSHLCVPTTVLPWTPSSAAGAPQSNMHARKEVENDIIVYNEAGRQNRERKPRGITHTAAKVARVVRILVLGANKNKNKNKAAHKGRRVVRRSLRKRGKGVVRQHKRESSNENDKNRERWMAINKWQEVFQQTKRNKNNQETKIIYPKNNSKFVI